MRADDLVAYCNTKAKKAFSVIPEPYWTTTIYSLGKYLREYGYYPSWLPLCVYTDHGMRGSHKPAKHELASDAPVQLCHSPETKLEWEKHSEKPCYIMFSPFVFYRKKQDLKVSQYANGTLAFLAHTTPDIEDATDLEIYIRELNQLPEEFHPVSVCLHMHDINKGVHRVFEKHEITVYTAGNSSDDRFAERFYEIVRNFRYATSTIPGSYLYYCIEMGVPFSLYGTPATFVNRNDSNLPKGKMVPCQTISRVYELFSGVFTGISEQQKMYVETSLGLNSSLSRIRMAGVLYLSFFKWLFSTRGIKFIWKWFVATYKKYSQMLVNKSH
jgi:hypothetical protein